MPVPYYTLTHAPRLLQSKEKFLPSLTDATEMVWTSVSSNSLEIVPRKKWNLEMQGTCILGMPISSYWC